MNGQNRANLYDAEGDTRKAADLLRDTSAGLERTLGPTHPDIGWSLNSLSDVLFKLGEKEESERLLERARAISERVYGPSHPATARAVASLARIRYQETELEEANRWRSRPWRFSEALGSHHPEVALMLALVGAILYREGRYSESESFYGRARDILLAVDPEVSTSPTCS